jgi:hypothetical protein
MEQEVEVEVEAEGQQAAAVPPPWAAEALPWNSQQRET